MQRPAPPSPAAAKRRRLIGIAIAAVVAVLIVLGSSATFYTDLLWFQETGFDSVYWKEIQTKSLLGLAFGAAFALVLLLNVWIARKITSPRRLFTVSDQVLERYRQAVGPYTKWIVIGGALVFGLFAGSGATAQWDSWLLFSNAEEFGRTDPQFGRDIGFYVFRLPFLRFLFTWAFSMLAVVIVVVGAVHYFLGGIRPQAQGGERVAPEVRAHLSALLGLLVLLKAWGYRLDQYDLVYSPRGTVTGASYTDINAQLPALRLLVIIAVLVGALFLANAFIRAWTLPLGGIALLALTSVLAGGVYPAFVQRVRVAPQERSREAPFIERNIEETRFALGIHDEVVEVTDFPARTQLTNEIVARNRSTLQNIRLWTPEVLTRAYLQLQRIRSYYDFFDVDVDRYMIDGEPRQVMLSAREMAQEGLPDQAKTWVNNHLVYTHGFGVVASRVDRVGTEGQPVFLSKDIPAQSVDESLELTQPRIYFGESEDSPYIIVKTAAKELDFPQGDGFEETTYDGEGGVEVANFMRRLAFAWRFRDFNMLASGEITSESRILFRRTVAERIGRVAPFLQLDGDPYIAVVDGRPTWILDAYTTTSRFPYSERINLGAVTRGLSGQANYIRNSVKATVDAFDGTITLYRWDESDPIIAAWGEAFPGVLTSRSEMSEDLLAHVRYPEDLFSLQTQAYTLYHMTDPTEFYSSEDAWAVPGDPTDSSATPRPMPPYYVLMTLPGETKTEFALIRPFTPNRRQNMIAWMAARSDPEDYGKLTSYVFPKQRQISGPEQVQARINQDPAVSQQVTLWDQQQSRVIYGNLLVIPIEDSLLYVQPLYLEGTGSQLPELKRVVGVTGETVKMAETLDGLLAALLGEAEPAPPEPDDEPGGDVGDALEEALRAYRAAQEALRNGDFATFGAELDKLGRALERADEEANPSGSPSPTPEASPAA